MVGIEPQNRWKHYSRSVLEVARESGAELVVTLGGFLADTPHTRPVPVTGSADGELADQLGLAPSSYEGPTGIVGVIHEACRDAGMPSASLWAAVPHYIQASPNPKAALALLLRLALLLDTRFDTTRLSQDAVCSSARSRSTSPTTRRSAATYGSSRPGPTSAPKTTPTRNPHPCSQAATTSPRRSSAISRSARSPARTAEAILPGARSRQRVTSTRQTASTSIGRSHAPTPNARANRVWPAQRGSDPGCAGLAPTCARGRNATRHKEHHGCRHAISDSRP